MKTVTLKSKIEENTENWKLQLYSQYCENNIFLNLQNKFNPCLISEQFYNELIKHPKVLVETHRPKDLYLSLYI